MIEVPVKSGEEEIAVFKFRPMSIEEASDWAAKMKARYLLRESLQKELDRMSAGYVSPEDEKKFLEITDRISEKEKQIVEFVKKLARFVVDPAESKVLSILDEHTTAALAAFETYLENLFPGEDDEKKS